jgi:caa(3)-type oxidase subunit IV
LGFTFKLGKTMEADAHELEVSVRKALRLYLWVGLILFCGTAATVAVATVPWLDVGGHGFDVWDAVLGLAIATIKAGLVASIFMHLNHERALIYVLIGLAGIHAIGMFVGTYWHFADFVHDRFFFVPPPTEQVQPRL